VIVVLTVVLAVVGYFVIGIVSAFVAARISKTVCEEHLTHLFVIAWPVVIPLALIVLLCEWVEGFSGCRDDDA
jgi:hypothetical protein